MGELVGAFASSHASTFLRPDEWDGFRALVRDSYRRRYGHVPPENNAISNESLKESDLRYSRIREQLAHVSDQIGRLRPDAIILIGDDQEETFPPGIVPQLAVYVGDAFTVNAHGKGEPVTWPCANGLARDILAGSINAGFDTTIVREFQDGRLASHAHAQILTEVLSHFVGIPVAVVFINALGYPTIEPSRCHEFGRLMMHVIHGRETSERVVVYASGGLSHFTAGFPWRFYRGPFVLGSISEEFDRRLLSAMTSGQGDQLSRLSSDDLLNNGDIEARAWIAAVGATEPGTRWHCVYEPFYRATLGMAVAYAEMPRDKQNE